MDNSAAEKESAAIRAQLRAEIAKSGDTLKGVCARAELNYGVVRRYMSGEREMPMLVFMKLCYTIGVLPETVLARARE